jgi:hypothetical protein
LLADQEFLRAVLSIVFGEFGFVIEEVEMARGSGHEKLDDPFGPWLVVGFSQNPLAARLPGEKGEEGNAAESAARLPKKVASCRHGLSPGRKTHSC